ncbi:DUF2808 domain-containing protein [Synechocystis salina LEGE 06155]|jgi:hypothetical protein|uniref:DUF2808 domain-containing protein n=1 Tax=Synechocystis sp. LEGE 06083 TaxID=915336 RepID=UPI0018817BB7|nr:DUF2808 domain-containing protein [Synechocystis sp. LEGE 06083]MBE9176817.1 DUF2808 domain-containing protein [Synechocystis salina LEGE 06155]MBE9193797.1 DUF2808 domain-containing protein [Synechocystis sp. LEGE 06083]
MKQILIASLMLSFLSVNFIKDLSFINSSAFAYDIKSGAIPNNASVKRAVHFFTINVPKTGLSSLTIQVPNDIKVNGKIEVRNQENKLVNNTYSIANNQVLIDFSPPASNNETLMIRLEDVSATGLGTVWIYRLYGTTAKIDTTIPLGSRQVRTYDN